MAHHKQSGDSPTVTWLPQWLPSRRLFQHRLLALRSCSLSPSLFFYKFRTAPGLRFSLAVVPFCSRRGGKPTAHSLARAALGLTQPNSVDIPKFVNEKVQWMHFDMAGPVWNEKKKPGATGFGISTLVEWVLRNSS